MTRRSAGDRWTAVAIAVGMKAVYNANGREIGSYDSQPNKYAARELLLRHTLTLNHVVGAAPALSEREAFALDLQGRYRSAYSPLPAMLAAGITWPLWKLRVIDIRAPRAPNVMAALSASILTGIAVGCLFLVARDRLPRRRAVIFTLCAGLGTGLWSTVSQTLWVHETAILGLSIAMAGFAPAVPQLSRGRALTTGLGLAIAGVARPQLAAAISAVLIGLFVRARLRDALLATGLVVVAAVVLMATYLRWFGHPLGPIALLEARSATTHLTGRTFAIRADAMLGLLVSPNRGLFVFSPI